MTKYYQDLLVWQKAIDLVDLVYDLTEKLPQQEQFGLKSQMRRSAVSVASNIAEGSERNSTKEYIQFLYIARGSLAELETQMFIANRRKFILQTQDFSALSQEVSKMIYYLIRSLENKINATVPLRHSATKKEHV